MRSCSSWARSSRPTIKPQLSDATKNLDYVYVGSSEEAIGAQLAEAMASGLDQGAKICALELALGQDNQIYRDKGFCDWLAENRPDIEILDKQSYKQEATAEAMSITEDWIQRFGVDGIDAIATQGSTITIGVIEALKSHDATDKIKVSGISIPPTMDWILDGTAYSDLYQDPMTEASKSVDAALKMIKGEEVALDDPDENWINVEMTTVTAENVQEVMANATY
ncbi:sugar ABC transporter substrate-binding protein [Butyricicoccus pullicaecorum]|nr:sugar ABC transporter substrate-binding protein [Butyricicoccus pullicaecorum]